MLLKQKLFTKFKYTTLTGTTKRFFQNNRLTFSALKPINKLSPAGSVFPSMKQSIFGMQRSAGLCSVQVRAMATPASKSSISDLSEAHENYGLFRKGQSIGYLSTLMEDPADAYVVGEKNYDEVHHYFDIPDLGENIIENYIQIKVSARENVPYNSPTGSWMQVYYPFAEKEELANKYVKFADNEIMIGKMLEEIDVISAETAYRFIRGRDNK